MIYLIAQSRIRSWQSELQNLLAFYNSWLLIMHQPICSSPLRWCTQLISRYRKAIIKNHPKLVVVLEKGKTHLIVASAAAKTESVACPIISCNSIDQVVGKHHLNSHVITFRSDFRCCLDGNVQYSEKDDDAIVSTLVVAFCYIRDPSLDKMEELWDYKSIPQEMKLGSNLQ